MKNLFVYLVLLLVLPRLNAQTVKIPFLVSPNSNLSYIHVNINGITEKFLFDTGASGITINQKMFNRMQQAGVISQSDYIRDINITGVNNYQVKAKSYRIKSVKIDDFEAFDLEAWLMPSASAGLIVGQSIFQKFGKVSIDYTNREIILEKTTGALKLKEVRLIPCSKNKLTELDKIKNILSSTVRPQKVSQEGRIPPPKKAVDRVKNYGVTIRYFDLASRDLALGVKQAIEGQYNAQIYLENMTPYYAQPIQEYIEIWLK